MNYISIGLTLFSTVLFSLTAVAQQVYDTIPQSEYGLKSSGNFIIQTLAEENNTLVINEFMASNSHTIMDEDEDFGDWFELYNYGDEQIDLSNYYFTDKKSEPLKWMSNSNYILEPGGFIILWADGKTEYSHHTSFKLSSNGEYLGVYTKDGRLVDEIEFDSQLSDISYGRYPDGATTFKFMEEPSPNTPNVESTVNDILSKPIVNKTSGMYHSTIMVDITTKETGSEIHYTTDCSEPTKLSPVFSDPISINSTTIIRARAYKNNCIESQTTTASYIFDDQVYENPIISLVGTDDDFNGSNGILNGIRDIEIPASMEFIKDGESVYTTDLGIQIHSPKSNKQYSMRFYARAEYGNSWFEYPFFEQQNNEQYKRLIIRNSGNDAVQIKSGNVHFRDQMVHGAVKDLISGSNSSASRPVNVYVNGEYFGLYNLRERIDQYYMQNHFPEIENYDLIERAFGYSANKHAIVGDFDHWNEIMQVVVKDGDNLSDTEYNEIKELVDVENFTNYWLSEVFIGNYDWLSNNLKFFIPEYGKSQWIYWDTDHGLGYKYSSYGNVDWNTLEWSLTFSDRAWSNGYNNRLVRNLLKNDNYRAYFIKQLSYLLNTKLTKDILLSKLDSIQGIYSNDILPHLAKWGSNNSAWEQGVDEVKSYVSNRQDEVFNHAKDFFKLQTPNQVSINVEPAGAGYFSLDNCEEKLPLIEGQFYPDFSYTVEAKANLGYNFVGWKEVESNDTKIITDFSDQQYLTAIFELEDHTKDIFINEVYYKGNDEIGCDDWLEITNLSTKSISLSSYKLFNNNGLVFTFPEPTTLNSNEYLILAANSNKFKKVYLEIESNIHEINLDLGPNENLILKDNNEKIVHNLNYSEGANNWPINNQEGFSYELINYNSEYETANNWQLSADQFGSPGILNTGSYNFHSPKATDAVLIGNENSLLLEIPISKLNFTDLDSHTLAAIEFININDNVKVSSNEVECYSGIAYPINHFFYEVTNTNTEAIITYRLIDNSGDTSNKHNIIINSALSIDDEKMSINAYPIPCNDFLNIEFSQFEYDNCIVKLYDMMGNVVIRDVITEDKCVLKTENLINGLYLLNIDNNGKKYTKRIIKVD